MRFPSSRWSARLAPLVAAVFLLCLGTFLCLNRSATGPQTATVHLSRLAHADGRSGGIGGHPTKAGYLAASMEEEDAGDERPINAEQLTTLLFVAFFGVVLGLLLGGRRILRRGAIPPLLERSSYSFPRLSPPEPTIPLLSVFRL